MTGLLLGLFAGIAFGYVITNVGATDPQRMARAHMMIEPEIPQFMLLTVLLSALGLTGLMAVGDPVTSVLPTSIVATGLAAILFGIGWGLAGYCPGTSWAAAGEGRLDAIFALLGGFAGTALFAHLHELLIPALYDPTNAGRLTLADAFGGSRTVGLVVLVAVLGVAIYAIGRIWKGHHKVPSAPR